jgi:hypothetical protein
MKLENGMRYWCWWMNRYIWYRGKIGDQFMFEDVVGVNIRLKQKDIERLRVNP